MKLATNLKTFLVSLILISFTATTFAAEPTIVKLKSGEKVPFPAWCFNLPAAAKVVADKEGEPARCQLKISEALERQKADFDFKLGSLTADLQYHKEVSSKTIAALEIENQELEKIALDKPNNYWYLWFGGGVVVTLTVYYVGTAIANGIALSTMN